MLKLLEKSARMNVVRTMGAPFVLFGAIFVSSPARAYDIHSGLRVFPYAGRPGSTLYLSGYGLKPLTRLYIMFACPNYQEAAQFGNLLIIPSKIGPKTDSQGQFSGWPMKAPKLNHVVSSGCTVYADDGVSQAMQPYGPTQLGPYYILGPKDPMQPCYKRICVQVTPTPKRVKSGRIENIDVQGWAGALANVTVTYPGFPAVTQSVKLDWNGSGRVRVPVPKDMQDTSHVRITVHCHLGQATGDRKAEFTVVH
jgi:hypothetical protein